MFDEKLEALLREANPGPAHIHMTKGGRHTVRFADFEKTNQRWLIYLPPEERALYLALRNHADSLLAVVKAAKSADNFLRDTYPTHSAAKELRQALRALEQP